MPIKGLTTERDIYPAYRMIGKLRKGGERPKSGKKPGPELDHWRFTSDLPEIEAAFLEAYGKEPKEIEVFFPHTDPDASFPTWCEIWGATGLVHRCDGENMSIWLVGDHYEKGTKTCDASAHTKGDAMNDVVGRLEFILPKLTLAGYVGVVIMETHSRHDLMQITKTLRKVVDDRRSPDGLRGVPFTLARIPREISVPGYGDQAGKRSRTTKHLAVLTPSATWVAANMQAAIERTGSPQLMAPRPLLDTGTEIIDAEVVEPPAPVEMNAEMAAWLKKELATYTKMPVEEKGECLWPNGLWEGTVRPLSVKALSTGEAGLDSYLTKKCHALVNEWITKTSTPGILIAHIDKAWKFGDLYHDVANGVGMIPNPFNMIKAAADLAVVIEQDPALGTVRDTQIDVMISTVSNLEEIPF